jgi:hypothetical protein
VPDHDPQSEEAGDAELHEKTELVLAFVINNILNPERSDAEELQRKEAALSYWFGVQGSGNEYFFEEGTAYEELLQVSESSSIVASQTYPALVSFVGETGKVLLLMYVMSRLP